MTRVVFVSRDLPLLTGGNSAALLAGLGLPSGARGHRAARRCAGGARRHRRARRAGHAGARRRARAVGGRGAAAHRRWRGRRARGQGAPEPAHHRRGPGRPRLRGRRSPARARARLAGLARGPRAGREALRPGRRLGPRERLVQRTWRPDASDDAGRRAPSSPWPPRSSRARRGRGAAVEQATASGLGSPSGDAPVLRIEPAAQDPRAPQGSTPGEIKIALHRLRAGLRLEAPLAGRPLSHVRHPGLPATAPLLRVRRGGELDAGAPAEDGHRLHPDDHPRAGAGPLDALHPGSRRARRRRGALAGAR